MVGNNGQIFWAHKAVLIDIPFFRLRFASTDLNTPELTLVVDMCKPAVFEIFLPFLYQYPIEVSEMAPKDIFRLIALHELCEVSWRTIKHANAVMAVMIAWVEQVRDEKKMMWAKCLTNDVYNRGMKGSTLRKFLVWYTVFNGVGTDVDMEWLEKAVKHDYRFAADVAFYSSRLYNKEVSIREIAISGLRGTLYLAENGCAAAG